MSRQPSLGDFVQQAKKGFFWRALGVYVLGSWIALQVVDVLVSSFGLPEWFPGFALGLLVIGLPIILATAIVQQGLAGGAPGDIATEASPGTTDPGLQTEMDGAAASATGGSDAAAGATPSSGPATPNLATGTGSLDRPTTRPPRLYRLLTWKNALTGGVLAFALWGVLAAAWLALSQWIGSDPAAVAAIEDQRLKAIAVLPFDNLSSDAENAHFADGIHEDVLTQLSKIAELTVISRTSVLAYRETDKSLVTIASELGVGSILEGSVRRSGDNVRITAQLIDAETDQHLWADNFDRGLTAANLFAVQTEIAEQIAGALRATLSPEEASRIARRPTDDLTAYDLYLKARDLYDNYVSADNEEAIRLFRAALEADPGYADAWAGLADAFGQRALIYGYPPSVADSAIAFAQRALELDPESAAAYKALALAHTVQQDVRASVEANLRAVALDPNHYGATNNLGVGYSTLGRFDEALRWYKRAARLSPTSFGPGNVAVTYNRLGEHEIGRRYLAEHVDHEGNSAFIRATYGAFIPLDAGDVDAALVQLERWREQNATIPITQSFEAEVHLARGDFERALDAARRAHALAPEMNRILNYHQRTALGYAMLRAGDAHEGERLLETQLAENRAAIDDGATVPYLWWEMGAIRAILGDTDAALELMAEAREQGFQPGLAFFADLDPMVESVREDARFQALVLESRVEIEQMRRRIEVEEIEAGER